MRRTNPDKRQPTEMIWKEKGRVNGLFEGSGVFGKEVRRKEALLQSMKERFLRCILL
jgi:hypothetical protein